MKDKILIIDAHNQMWRACVKFGKTLPDQPDEVIFAFNFFRNLRPIIEKFSPDKCFFVLEGHPQFRYDLFPDYKANRIKKRAEKQNTTDTFFKLKDIIVPMMSYLPITIARAKEYEADDVVGTLADNLKNESITILSSDTDYIQLLQKGYEDLQIYNPIKKSFMESPDYPYVAWKCLNGDKSDNIPSILKPAKALATSKDPEAFKSFLLNSENKEKFNLNRDLIEFRDVPVDQIEMVEGSKNFTELRQEFIKLKFDSITNVDSWVKYCKTFDCIKY